MKTRNFILGDRTHTMGAVYRVRFFPRLLCMNTCELGNVLCLVIMCFKLCYLLANNGLLQLKKSVLQ